MVLGRTDLSKEMLEKCMDCLPEYDGVKVEFKIPEFELYNIDLQRLGNDPTYKGIYAILLEIMHATNAD